MSNNVISFPVSKQVQPTFVPKVPSIVRKLACALMLKLRIDTGMSLVCLLNDHNEHSNQNALETWLMEQFGVNTIEAMHSPLEQLTCVLVTHLNNQLNDLED